MQASPPGLSSSSLGAPAVPLPHLLSFIPPLFALPLLNSLADPTRPHPKQHSIRVGCTDSLPCWHCSLTTPQKCTNPWEGQWSSPGGFPIAWQTPASCRAACVTTQRDSTGMGNALRAQLSHLVKLSPCQHPARSGKRLGSTKAPPDVSSWERAQGQEGEAQCWQWCYKSCCKDANHRG